VGKGGIEMVVVLEYERNRTRNRTRKLRQGSSLTRDERMCSDHKVMNEAFQDARRGEVLFMNSPFTSHHRKNGKHSHRLYHHPPLPL
jgi:hypothetical protein